MLLWLRIKECVAHGIAEDEQDAGVQAVNAGLDMDMGTHIFKDCLKKAVEDGLVPIEQLDDAVRRILSVKIWLGLFENPYVSEEGIERYRDRPVPAEHAALALEAAKRSAVLLKNDGDLLPLKKDCRVSLVGALADDPAEVIGAWAMSWKPLDCVTIRQGMERLGVNFGYHPCGGPEGSLNGAEIERACADGDVIVAVVGETCSMSGEASSKADISLPGRQRELLQKLLDSGKPVVAVLMNGRPLALGWEAEHIPAILEGWHLGICMGDAIAALLYGGLRARGPAQFQLPGRKRAGAAVLQPPQYRTSRKQGQVQFSLSGRAVRCAVSFWLRLELHELFLFRSGVI